METEKGFKESRSRLIFLDEAKYIYFEKMFRLFRIFLLLLLFYFDIQILDLPDL